jgi:hypothetical protein
MAVKSVHLKKLLLILVLICVGMVALLYWGRLEELYRIKPRAAQWSAWTWECENDHCVRKVRKQEGSYIPLASCRMHCGPIPLWPLPRQVTGIKRQSVGFGHVRMEIIADGDHVQGKLTN